MGGSWNPVDWVEDIIDWGEDVVDIIDGDAQEEAEEAAAAAAAAQQAEYEAAMAAEAAANQAYMEEESRRNRIAGIRDTRADRKRLLLKQRKAAASKKAGEKRGAEGARLTGVAAARGGTGKLKTGAGTRGASTQKDYGKWGAKGSGLSLTLRGAGATRKRPQ